MKIIRVKITSECIGIRRMKVAYLPYRDEEYDLACYEHPMKEFNKAIVSGSHFTLGDLEFDLALNQENAMMTSKVMQGITGEVTEHKKIQILPLELSMQMENRYKEAILNNEWFDDLNGEFEYLLGLTYYYCDMNETKALEWFEKAKKKGFETKLWN